MRGHTRRPFRTARVRRLRRRDRRPWPAPWSPPAGYAGRLTRGARLHRHAEQVEDPGQGPAAPGCDPRAVVAIVTSATLVRPFGWAIDAAAGTVTRRTRRAEPGRRQPSNG